MALSNSFITESKKVESKRSSSTSQSRQRLSDRDADQVMSTTLSNGADEALHEYSRVLSRIWIFASLLLRVRVSDCD